MLRVKRILAITGVVLLVIYVVASEFRFESRRAEMDLAYDAQTCAHPGMTKQQVHSCFRDRSYSIQKFGEITDSVAPRYGLHFGWFRSVFLQIDYDKSGIVKDSELRSVYGAL